MNTPAGGVEMKKNKCQKCPLGGQAPRCRAEVPGQAYLCEWAPLGDPVKTATILVLSGTPAPSPVGPNTSSTAAVDPTRPAVAEDDPPTVVLPCCG
jgi:hypothetical protein